MLCVQWLVHTLGTKASALSRVNHYIGNSPHAVLIQLTISSVLWRSSQHVVQPETSKIAHCACVYKFNVPFNLDQNHGSGTNLSCSYLQKGIASICLSMACGGSEGLTPCPLCSGCDQRQALHTENSRDATSLGSKTLILPKDQRRPSIMPGMVSALSLEALCLAGRAQAARSTLLKLPLQGCARSKARTPDQDPCSGSPLRASCFVSQ